MYVCTGPLGEVAPLGKVKQGRCMKESRLSSPIPAVCSLLQRGTLARAADEPTDDESKWPVRFPRRRADAT